MIERAVLGVALLGLLAMAYFVAWRLYQTWQRNGARKLARLVAGGPTILYFTTPDCFTCRVAQEPELERLQRGRPGIPVIKINALQRRDLARGFRVLTVPTTVVVDARGEVVAVNNGLAPADQLLEQLGVL